MRDPVTPQLLRDVVSKASDDQLRCLVSALNTGHFLATAECVDDSEEYLMVPVDMWSGFAGAADELGVKLPKDE